MMLTRVAWSFTMAVGMGLVAAPARALDDLSLVVEPGSAAVAPGDTITVTLRVANLSEAINGVQVRLLYDDALMSLTSLAPTDLAGGGLISAPGAGWTEVFFNDAAGALDFSAIITEGDIPVDHTIATLSFTAIAEGPTAITFRPDAPPFVTTLTASADSAAIPPTTSDSGAIDIACDDGLFCNGLEVSDGAGGCLAGSDPCDDGVGCTDDSCDEGLDSCTNAPNDANCDNLDFCDGAETCDALLDCQAGTPPCVDSVFCTDDLCDEGTDSCSFPPNDANCDNLDFCDGAETCDATLDCQPGTFPCDDGVGCTVDTCDETFDTCTSTPNDALCDNNIFCDGPETCDPIDDCLTSVDPCAPLVCDESTDSCFAPVHVVAVEVFYAGRFLGVCAGGDNHGAGCADDAGCPNGTCDLFRSAPDPTRFFLAPGSLAVAGNVTNSVSGITGVRVAFDTIVDFATTADAAFALEWSLSPVCVGGTRDGLSCDPQNGGDACLTEGGVCDVPFEPVLNVPSNVTISPVTVDGVTEVDIAIADNHVRRRWLKVTVDATQVTSGGVALDGETVGNPIAVPSGDGAPGGDAVFFVGNMPGDVTGDRKTLLADVGATRLQVNPFLTVDITDAYDVDRDGKVLLADVGKARMDVNPFQTLPLIAP